MGRMEVGFSEEGREWKLPNLILCGESEEELRVMKGGFAEVYEERSLRADAYKGKGMVLGEEAGGRLDVSGR